MKILQLFNPPDTYAQIKNPALGNDLQKLNGVSFFDRLIPSLISIGFIVGIIVFVYIFISGAISWMTSGGDKGQTETARNKLMQALVGIVILFSLFAIIKLIETFFDLDLMSINITSLKL